MLARFLFAFLTLSLSASAFCPQVFAQQASVIGRDPQSSHDSSVDDVDLATLNVHVEVPLYGRQGRGSGTNDTVNLVYDNGYIQGSIDVGWHLGTPSWGSVQYAENNPVACDDNNHVVHVYVWSFTDGDGVTHNYGSTTASDCDQSTSGLDEYPTDKAPYHLIAQGTDGYVILPSGGITRTSGVYTDSNGNSIDTLWLFNGSSGTHTSTTGNAPQMSGGQNNDNSHPTARTPMVLSYKDTNGNTQTVTVSYKFYQFDSVAAFGTADPHGALFNVGFVDKITYADGRQYSFTYEPSAQNAGAVTGRLASMTLPTGGVVNYSYPSGARSGLPFSSLGRSGPEGNAAYTRTITQESYAAGNQYSTWTTKILRQKPSGGTDETDVTFATDFIYRGLETGRRIYEGSAAGTPLLATTRCYNGATGDCTQTIPHLPITETDETESYNGGSATRKKTFYNNAHLVTETDEYDFGGSSLLRKKVTQYASLGNNIVDRPSSVQVQDGSGHTLTTTTFSYDDYALVTPNGSTPNRTDVSGSRGNLTQRNEPQGTTQIHYDTAGQIAYMLDPKSNRTDFQYDAGTDTVLAKITHPATNGVQHVTQTAVNQYTGLPDSTTDENNIVTQISYDGSLRETLRKRAAGTSAESRRTTSYTSANQITVKQDRASDNDQVLVTTEVLDSYGRLSKTTSPAGIAIDRTYDVRGRLQSQSNPYYASGSSTGSYSLSYDALDRVISKNYSDGNSVSFTFSGSSVTEQDEASHSWTRSNDALGRLASVQEPTGRLTTYTYDVMSNLLCADQWGTSTQGTACTSSRARSFVYDAASRLTSSSNPESGTIGYVYDANGNVTSKTDARNVVVNYTFDALNRLTHKTYSNGDRNQWFAYDGKDEQGNDMGSPWMTAAIGRLSHTSDSTSVASNYAYDIVGHLVTKADCTPSDCSYGVSQQAGYDLAGNLTSMTYPSGRQVFFNHDNTGRLTTVTGAGNTAGTYLSSISYNADGAPASVTYGNGVVETTTENSRMQVCEDSVASGSQSFLDRQYFFGTNNTSGQQCNSVAGDNGNIWNINDGLGGSYSQNFSYDSLNRVSAWTAPNMAGAYRHIDYLYDSYGNLVQSSQGSNFSVENFYTAKNQLPAGWFNCTGLHGETGGYDNAGNTLCGGTQNQNAQAYVWNGENLASQIWGQQNNNSYNPVAGYLYDAQGQRVRSEQYGFTNSVQSWREYTYFNGQVLAERDQSGGWSDYIYANGKRIARADNYDQRIVLAGDNASSVSPCNDCNGDHAVGVWIPNAPGYTIKNGDKFHFRETGWTSNASGGIYIDLCGSSPDWQAQDQYGNLINSIPSASLGVWQTHVIDMSAYAGQTICRMFAVSESTSGPGHYVLGFADIAMTSTDGSTKTFFYRDPSAAISVSWVNQNASNTTASNVQGNIGNEINHFETTLTYYANDQVGTASLLISSQGWPVWKGEFTPFGAELDTGSTANRFKFTGKERDTESGLDYFGARYYASGIGRFVLPDSQDEDTDPEPVPWADFKNPQSLNLYSYVHNNPIAKSDRDGHDVQICTTDGNAGQHCTTVSNEEYRNAQQGNNGSLIVPSLNNVGMNGSANITDSGGNVVGTATYVPDSGADFYSQGGPQAYGQLAAAAKLVNAAGAVEITALSIVMPELLTETVPEVAGMTGVGRSGASVANKLNHIFGKARHNLDGVVEATGGRLQAYEAIQNAASAATKGTAGPFEVTVEVGGQNLVVRGTVVNEVVKIGTAFKP